MDAIDHSAWSALLTRYVDSNGRVNYSRWKDSKADQAALDTYLNSLSKAKTAGSSKNGRLAFWINAYNAVTIRGILNVYPTTSIRNHTATLIGFNIWKDLFLYVDGKPYCLDDMEHKLLRPMKEPRIHFAIVCASIGCPRLLNTAYRPTKIDQQLTQNTIHFFSHRQNLQYDRSTNRLKLSAILDWFQEDFGTTETAMLNRIQVWVSDPSANQAIAKGNVRVEFLDYNWKLNDQKTKAKTAAPKSP